MTTPGSSYPLPDLMKVALGKCSECEQIATKDAWDRAWWVERSARISAGHEPWFLYGLDQRLVCPSCGFVHSDNDMSAVEEIQSVAARPEPSAIIVTAETPASEVSHEVTAKRRTHGNGWLWACSCGL